MIFYLATYPRSGNSQLQSLITKNLCFLTSQVKAAGVEVKPAEWLISSDASHRARWPADTFWNDRIQTYVRVGPAGDGIDPDGRRWRYFRSGPAPDLEVRRALAAEPEPFFIKTHDLPFDTYFEGERVIQIHRAPGAVMWSYFRYQMDFVLERDGDHMFERPPVSLDRVIEGDVAFGDWSDYHLAWGPALEALGPRALVLRYAEMGRRPAEVLETLSGFIGQRVERREVEDFQSYRARFAGKGLRGSEQGYEPFFTRRQLERLWERHGAVARKLGFSEPDYDWAAEAEQIERLTRVIEIAWEWGRVFDGQRRKMNNRLEGMLKRNREEPGG